MRTDCIRDNRKIPLPNASRLGSGLGAAKRGNWIAFDQGPGMSGHCGRVLGRVVADGQVYVEIVALFGAVLATRWIKPENIIQCIEKPPRRVWEWLSGDWSGNAPGLVERLIAEAASGEVDLKRED